MSKKEISVNIKLDGEGITDLISMARNVEYDMLHGERERSAIAHAIGQYYGWHGKLDEIKYLLEGFVSSFVDCWNSLNEKELVTEFDFDGRTKEFFAAFSKVEKKKKD